MNIRITPLAWFRRAPYRRRALDPDELGLSWQHTLLLWDQMREEADSPSAREEIDAIFSRQVP